MRAVTGLLQRVIHTIDRYRMFTAGQKVGVAVSGGADSVCLLHVLLELAPERCLRLAVLHLNHRLRGGESDQDAEFVRRLSEQLGLPFHLREADLAGCAEGRGKPGCFRETRETPRRSQYLHPDNLEQAARHARLAFFREMTESLTVDSVAVGHTRSDQAETVLFRFLRGSGTAGLAGVRPVTSDGVVRPLLAVGRDEVEQFLRDRGIAWREDSSNASPQFARNRIRHDLLPQLASQWNPGIREILANTADWAQAEEAYWAAEIDRLAAGRLLERDGAIGWCAAPSRGPRATRAASVLIMLRQSWRWPRLRGAAAGCRFQGWRSCVPSSGCVLAGLGRTLWKNPTTRCPWRCREACGYPVPELQFAWN